MSVVVTSSVTVFRGWIRGAWTQSFRTFHRFRLSVPKKGKCPKHRRSTPSSLVQIHYPTSTRARRNNSLVFVARHEQPEAGMPRPSHPPSVLLRLLQPRRKVCRAAVHEPVFLGLQEPWTPCGFQRRTSCKAMRNGRPFFVYLACTRKLQFCLLRTSAGKWLSAGNIVI